MNKEDKIVVYKVDVGFNVDEEIHKILSSEISDQTKNDINEVLSQISEKPSNKNTMEKIELDKKLEELYQKLLIDKVHKNVITETIGKNLISSSALLNNYVKKFHNSGIIKDKDHYKLSC